MKNPQTLAETLYQMFPNERLFTIKENSCCILTFLWVLGIEPKEDVEAIMLVSKLIDKGVIGKDCLVYWIDVARHLTGREIAVENVKIKNLKGIKERTPVLYRRTYTDKNGDVITKEHWVGVQNGKIRFNSLEDSLTVKEGKPVEARIIKIIKEG